MAYKGSYPLSYSGVTEKENEEILKFDGILDNEEKNRYKACNIDIITESPCTLIIDDNYTNEIQGVWSSDSDGYSIRSIKIKESGIDYWIKFLIA